MADENNLRPLIIVKIKKAKHEPHGGAWKVAFADFMTAMFALFLVLWILTQSPELKKAVAAYFRNEVDFEGKPDTVSKGMGGLKDRASKSMIESANPPKGKDPGQGSKEGELAQEPGKPLAKKSPNPGTRPAAVEPPEIIEKQELGALRFIVEDLWKKMGLDPSFQKYQHNLAIEAIEDGLVIQIVAQPKFPLFEEGTTTFTPAIKKLIATLAKRLENMPNKMEIDGHGVEAPPFYDQNSKWMASTAMAEATRAELEVAGYPMKHITKVAGCADARPLVKDPKPNTHERLLNQRISILVRPQQWKPERF